MTAADTPGLAVRMLAQQGYVPATCQLFEEIAFALVMSEVKAGRSPCSGCNHDRMVCKGKPKESDVFGLA